MLLHVVILLALLSLTLSQGRGRNRARDILNSADFNVDIPSFWQSTWTGKSLQFKPLDTNLIGEGSITSINATDQDNMASLLDQAVSEQTIPNRNNFEDFKADNGYNVLRNIEDFDLLGVKVVGYSAVIKTRNKYYQLNAYYEPGIRDVMKMGIDRIIRTFKCQDN
jgi:hypothetical protein